MPLDSRQERPKKFRVYRNGDQLFPGKEVAVSRIHTKNWDVFLENLTSDLRNTEAVRELCTPTGGTPVRSFDDIIDKHVYVAVGKGKFKDIGYQTLFEQIDQKNIMTSRRQPAVADRSPEGHPQVNQPITHRNNFDARSRLHDTTSTDVINIFVYANGNALEAPRRITIPRRLVGNLNHVMNEINQHVKLISGAARLLYTTDGRLVYEPDQQLENRGYYVAVGSEFGGFRRLNYGSFEKPAFTTSMSKPPNRKPETVRRSYYPNGNPQGQGGSGVDDSVRSSAASGPIPAHVWKNNRRGVTRSHDGSLAEGDRGANYRQENVRRGGNERHSVEIDNPRRYNGGPFHAKPRDGDRQGAGQTYRQVDYDRDEGGVFKSKLRNRERADEVQETRETRTELPVDLQRAEEIDDEDDAVRGRRRRGVVVDGRLPQRQVKPPPPHQQQQQPRGSKAPITDRKATPGNFKPPNVYRQYDDDETVVDARPMQTQVKGQAERVQMQPKAQLMHDNETTPRRGGPQQQQQQNHWQQDETPRRFNNKQQQQQQQQQTDQDYQETGRRETHVKNALNDDDRVVVKKKIGGRRDQNGNIVTDDSHKQHPNHQPEHNIYDEYNDEVDHSYATGQNTKRHPVVAANRKQFGPPLKMTVKRAAEDMKTNGRASVDDKATTRITNGQRKIENGFDEEEGRWYEGDYDDEAVAVEKVKPTHTKPIGHSQRQQREPKAFNGVDSSGHYVKKQFNGGRESPSPDDDIEESNDYRRLGDDDDTVPPPPPHHYGKQEAVNHLHQYEEDLEQIGDYD